MFSQSIDPFGFHNRPVVHHPSGPRQSRQRPRQRQSSHNTTTTTISSSSNRSKRPSFRRTAEEKEEERQLGRPPRPQHSREHPRSQPLSRSQQLLWEERHLDLPPVKTACAEEFRQADGRGDGVDILNDEGNEEVELMYRRLDLLSRLDNVNNDRDYQGNDGDFWLYGHERTNSCPLLLSDLPYRDEEEVDHNDDDAKDRTEGSREDRRDIKNSIPIPCCNGDYDYGGSDGDNDIAIDRTEKGRAKKNRCDSEEQDRDLNDNQDLLLSSSLERDCSSSSSFPPRTIVLRPDGRFYTMLDHHVGRNSPNTTSTLSRPSLWSRTRSSGCRHPVGYDSQHHRQCHVDDDDERDDDGGANNSTSKRKTRHGRYSESSNDHPDEIEENSTDDEDDEAPPHIIALEDVSDDEDEEILELASVWRNRSPSRGQWIEPDDSFQSLDMA